jgi:hypothetical protein
VITGIMLMMGRVFGFVLTLFMAYVSHIDGVWGVVTMFFNFIIALVLTYYLKEDLKRSKLAATNSVASMVSS